jgi:hypothetical protein
MKWQRAERIQKKGNGVWSQGTATAECQERLPLPLATCCLLPKPAARSSELSLSQLAVLVAHAELGPGPRSSPFAVRGRAGRRPELTTNQNKQIANRRRHAGRRGREAKAPGARGPGRKPRRCMVHGAAPHGAAWGCMEPHGPAWARNGAAWGRTGPHGAWHVA